MRQMLVRKQCVLCVVTLGGLGRCAVIVLRAHDLFGGPARLGPLLLCWAFSRCEREPACRTKRGAASCLCPGLPCSDAPLLKAIQRPETSVPQRSPSGECK